MKVTSVDTFDVRFPTSRELDGSDAMNPDPDYSAAYVILHTGTELDGHGFTFTIGRANEVGGAYQVPTAPGFSAQLRPSIFEQYAYPDGTAWA